MARCVIFCAALCQGPVLPPEPGDYVIAADGGLAHAVKFGISPDEILGDFDSLGYTPADARVFPVEKDDTDAMLAVRRGLSLGYREMCFTAVWTAPGLTTPWQIFRPCNICATTVPSGICSATGRWSPW